MEEQVKKAKTKENFNPLKDELVEVRFLKSQSEMYNNPQSPLYGGLADTASVTYAVPLKNGMVVNVLTPEEQKFFENLFGLEEGAMNPMLMKNNYWTTYNKGFINRVTLDKTTKRLDLKNPKDYIEYKILLANSEYICKSQEDFENNRKATYRFIMNNEHTVVDNAGKSAELKLENFEYFAKYKEDPDMLRTIIYFIEHKKVSPKTKLDLLKAKLVDLMETDPRACNTALKSKNIEQKKVLVIGVEKGVISERNGFYYITDNGQKIAYDYEDSTLNNAANYLADTANQELYFNLSKRIK